MPLVTKNVGLLAKMDHVSESETEHTTRATNLAGVEPYSQAKTWWK